MMPSPPRWALPLLVFAFLLAAWRGGALLAHDPLLAIANSYDQARYSGCFDLYPDRPAYIRADTNSPEAPFSRYAFLQNPVPLCYLSTELLPEAVVAAGFHIQAMAGGATTFDIRWLGWLRWLTFLGLGGVFCLAWWRAQRWPAALANGAVLAIVAMDPANTLYFSTFYAESSALLALYALTNTVLLWHGTAIAAKHAVIIAALAFALSISKIQHLALPLALGGAVVAQGWLAERRWRWQGIAVLCGAALGCLLQFAQLARGDLMMASIRSYNRADVVFTALLPHVADPAATLEHLGLPAKCVAYIGKPAWQLPGLAEDVCAGIGELGRGAIVRELAREPLAAMGLALSGVKAMHPWIAPNLGIVEGQVMAPLPESIPTLSRTLDAFATLRYALFAAPLIAALLLLRRRDRFALFTLWVATLGPATLGVILLGDGLADVPKQSHLIFNADLMWCVALPILWLAFRHASTDNAPRRSGYAVQ